MVAEPEQFLAEAAALLGPRGLTRDADLITPWLTDWRGRYTGAALAPGQSPRTGAIPGRAAGRHPMKVAGQSCSRCAA